MRIDIFTLFPNMFQSPFGESIVKRALEQGLVNIHIHNIRDYAHDKHHVVDDYPYGGGAGMVMKPEPIFTAVETVRENVQGLGKPHIILLSPQGRVFSQQKAEELASHTWVILVCGHYEGVDERIREHLATDEISIGDYVLTGGELPSMVVVDAVIRRIPGVLGSPSSGEAESFTGGLLEYPQYTRPAEYRSWKVPEILLSGHHAQVAQWRRHQSIIRTLSRRPDLLGKAPLTDKERRSLEEVEKESEQASPDKPSGVEIF